MHDPPKTSGRASDRNFVKNMQHFGAATLAAGVTKV